jgi:hypothetical protein
VKEEGNLMKERVCLGVKPFDVDNVPNRMPRSTHNDVYICVVLVHGR